MYTLYNFLTEMETWTKPFKNDEERARIKKLKINTKIANLSKSIMMIGLMVNTMKIHNY
jgi:hypothetical protein